MKNPRTVDTTNFQSVKNSSIAMVIVGVAVSFHARCESLPHTWERHQVLSVVTDEHTTMSTCGPVLLPEVSIQADRMLA
jgi:hypothetical protein